jgi:hypothetical protein
VNTSNRQRAGPERQVGVRQALDMRGIEGVADGMASVPRRLERPFRGFQPYHQSRHEDDENKKRSPTAPENVV